MLKKVFAILKNYKESIREGQHSGNGSSMHSLRFIWCTKKVIADCGGCFHKNNMSLRFGKTGRLEKEWLCIRKNEQLYLQEQQSASEVGKDWSLRLRGSCKPGYWFAKEIRNRCNWVSEGIESCTLPAVPSFVILSRCFLDSAWCYLENIQAKYCFSDDVRAVFWLINLSAVQTNPNGKFTEMI